jgi:hypothetical protein
VNRLITSLAGVAVAASLALVVAAPVGASSTAMVRVLHASPDAPAVDVYLDGTKVSALTDVPFGVISGYLAVPAGAHNVKVYATGTTTNPVIDADVTLTAGQKYTIAATGALATITAQVITDSPTPSCSTAQVRVVHFSADAPAVDIATTGSTPAQALIKSLTYPNATAYLGLPPGTYDLEVRLAGTTTVALPLPGVKIAACDSYSVFAIGSAASPAVGGHGLQVVVAVDGTATAAATMPATDTADPTQAATAAGGVGGQAAILVVVAALALLGGLRFVGRRARQD